MDALSIFERLNFAGVQLVAVSQGIDSSDDQAEVLVTVHGLVDSLYVKEIGKKTRRGLEGNLRRGLHTGGRCYGYANVGPERGKHLVVEDAEAEVVRRIFTLSAQGYSLKRITKRLNAERVPAPRPRRGRAPAGWCPTAIREMLRNERYIGRVIWNRNRFVKVPGTNRRVARQRPESEWRIELDPAQRIVSDELWNGVQGRLRWLAENFGAGSKPGLLTRNASSRYLLSGLLYCAECGSRLTILSGHGKKARPRYGCPRNFYRSTCGNDLRERQDRLEVRLLAGLQRVVLQPEAVEYTLQQFERELSKRLQEMSGGLERLRARKAEIEKELRHLVDTAAQTGPSAFLVEGIADGEKELREVTDQLLSTGPDSLQANLDDLRKFILSRLADVRGLLCADVERARTELAQHVDRIVMRPSRRSATRGITWLWVSGISLAGA